MHYKPLIGLNADFRPARNDAPAFTYLMSGYYDCILASGGIPVIVPPMEEEDDLKCVLNQLQGFVLVGGGDLDPRRDGFMLHPAMRLLDPRRESSDRLLARMLGEMKMPTFGIGAGMQLLNVSQGGNLMFHLPEDMPSALPHKDTQDAGHRHGLEIAPGSLMERVYGDGEIRVNSMHHMAVDDVASCFKVTARCPDGVIEAFESAQLDWHVVATQFHPQAESASALDVRIFEEFIDGVKERESSDIGVEPMHAKDVSMIV